MTISHVSLRRGHGERNGPTPLSLAVGPPGEPSSSQRMQGGCWGPQGRLFFSQDMQEEGMGPLDEPVGAPLSQEPKGKEGGLSGGPLGVPPSQDSQGGGRKGLSMGPLGGSPSQNSEGGDSSRGSTPSSSTNSVPSIAPPSFVSSKRGDVVGVSGQPIEALGGLLFSKEEGGFFEKEGRYNNNKSRKTKKGYFSFTSLFYPSDKWIKRIPFLGVLFCLVFGLIAFAICFSLLVSSLLDELEKARIESIHQDTNIHFFPSYYQDVVPPLPQSKYLPPMNPFSTPDDSFAPTTLLRSKGFAQSFELGWGGPPWTGGPTQGAPHRRLQSIVSIGPPDGASGFDPQNMWEAFKGAPQDYLLILWFCLNICLAGCFCSWLCTQRSYQKAVVVSP